MTKIFVGQGCDIKKDAIVLKSGELVGASEIGLLATVGVMMVKVLGNQNFICPLIYITKGLCVVMFCRYILPQQLLCFLQGMNLLSQQLSI